MIDQKARKVYLETIRAASCWGLGVLQVIDMKLKLVDIVYTKAKKK